MTTIDFKFSCAQYVIISVFGIDAEGRIVRQIRDGDMNIYDVHYAMNGELKREEFYEDELLAKEKK